MEVNMNYQVIMISEMIQEVQYVRQEKKNIQIQKELKLGTQTIKCIATSTHNKIAEVEKEVEVLPQQGKDEVLEGWIRLNLYYPENSTNWQWRLDGENGIRTGYDGEGWEDYTGPILVKIEDVPNIFIRYDIEGETYIIPPKGKVLVDIEPDYYTLKEGKKTNVRITYDKNAKTKEYRINGGIWKEYEGVFQVEANTIIEARATKNENVYDNHGNLQYVQTKTGTDSVYISVEELPTNEPVSASTGGTWKPTSTGGTWTPSGPGGLPIGPGGERQYQQHIQKDQ